MHIRSIVRWTLALLPTFAALIVTLAALNNPAAQAHRLNSIINCAGSIQTCIDSAIDGDTIVIAAGDYTESLTLNKAVSLTGVNSATTIIHALPNDRVLTVTVALTSSTIISGLTFMGGNVYGVGGIVGGIYAATGTLTLLNSRIVSNTYTGVDTYDAIIIGCLFLNNLQGLNVQHTLYSTSSAFINNGGGVTVDGATTIVDSWFENTSGYNGYTNSGLSVSSGGLILSNTTFISNSQNAVYISDGSAAVYGGRFERNSGDFSGGLFAPNSMIAVTDTVFIRNSSGTFAGGLVAYSVQIVGGRFENNTGNSGGAIFALSQAIVTGTVFVSNSASYRGGAIDASGALIDHARFEGNTSAGDGGGLFVGYYLLMTDTQFVSNTTAGSGGAVRLSEGIIVNTRFAQNAAGQSGTVLAGEAGNIKLQHVTIADVSLSPTSAIEVSAGTLGITDTIIANHAIAINNSGATVYEDYNLFYDNLTNTVGSIITGGHSLSGDPKFVDPANDDYRLGFGSAAIDHGVDVGLNTDLDGHPRDNLPDIGAYEFIWPYRWYFPIIYKQ
jgi:predicted outer membrane repeat protein